VEEEEEEEAGIKVCPATGRAVRVLQAEAGLVALGHTGSVQGEQVIVGEHLDAVVVPGRGEHTHTQGGGTRVKHVTNKSQSNQLTYFFIFVYFTGYWPPSPELLSVVISNDLTERLCESWTRYNLLLMLL